MACPSERLLKSFKVYPRRVDFNYKLDKFFIYMYLDPFQELKKAKTFKAGGTEYCFAYQPIYLGKGTGAGYRQNQHLQAFLKGRENNTYKVKAMEKIRDGIAKAVAEGDTSKPYNWKEYQEGWIIVLETFNSPKELLKFEMELIKSIGVQKDKSGPLANKITNAYAFDNLSNGIDEIF